MTKALVPMLVLLLSCGDKDPKDSGTVDSDGGAAQDGGGTDGGGTDGGGTDDGGTDGGGTDGGGTDGGGTDGGSSSDGGAEAADACPDGMVPVPTDDPDYCIDAYELSLDELEQPVSVAGAVPLTAISFDDARTLCDGRPVLDETGGVAGYMRLASVSQWQDAGDGTVGDGGWLYPYGNDWDDETCATTDADGNVLLDELQPTGSYPGCVSDFGTYDQVGNAWEWADPGISVNMGGFIDAREAEGIFLKFDDDGAISWLGGDFGQIELNVAGVNTGSMEINPEAQLVVPDSGLEASTDGSFAFTGYLAPWAFGDADGTDFFPVQVDIDTDVEGGHPVVARWEEDAAPVTAKVGCAWYVGSASGCILQESYYWHTHDFTGTISLRCVSDPLPSDR